MKKLIAFAFLSLLASCGVNEAKGKRILESQGLSNVLIGGYAFWGCGQDDDFASTFTAKDSKGNDVSGVVCGGVFKGYTVRFD